MRKLLARVLAAAMVVGLLSVPAFAYDVPDNTLLEASNPSSGSTTVTDNAGKSYTVYRYPAVTVFTSRSAMTNFERVRNLSTGEYQYGINQQFTLPETGAYELIAFDEGIWSTEAYVTAEGSGSVDPEPEATWYKTPDNRWIYSDAASTGSVTVTDYEGTSQTVYQYPVGTAFSIQSGQMTGGAHTIFLTGLYDLATGTSLSLHNWTLPASGCYKLEAYDSWGGPTTYAYVTAGDGSSQPEPEPERIFSDVAPDAWYAGFVQTVYEKGLFAGAGDGTFAPEANMDYAQFLTVLSQFSGETITAVPGGAWYDGYVNWAKEKNLIPEEMLKDFNPTAPITRQDMAALFASFLETYNVRYDKVMEGDCAYTDAASIADYAADGVTACLRAGIMSGNADGSFNPTGTATRAQVAVTMVQMARVMGK